MKKVCLSLSFLLLIAINARAQTDYKTLSKDLQQVTGSWKGTLTYLDYTSGKSYTMPANMELERIGKTNKFKLSNIYPNETNANSIDTIIISIDGKYIDKEKVTSRCRLPDGTIEIITEETGIDGNDHQPALFRHTYILSKNVFKKRKDIQFTGASEWINRHEYAYTK